MEKLVEMITKEVMKRLPDSTEDTTLGKEKVLVVCSSDEELTKVKELVEDKYEVHIYDKADINLKNYEHIIVTNLCNKGLASMALGLCNDNVQAFIVEALLSGKKVYLLKEGIQYRKYLNTVSVALYNLYKEYESKILSYGIALVHEKSLLESIETGVACSEEGTESICVVEVSTVSSEGITSSKVIPSKIEEQTKVESLEDTLQSHQVVEINNKRLITESDLRKLYMNGIKEVNVIKKAIFTPLAQDFIRIKRLKINRV